MTLALAALLDVTLVLAVTLILTTALRRRSASLRHALLAATLLAAAAAPALELIVPAWEVPITWRAPAQQVSTLTLSSSTVTGDAAASSALPAKPSIDWFAVIGIAWIAGAVVTFAGLVAGLLRLLRETRRCAVIRSGPWRERADELSRRYALTRPVVLLQSDSPSLLLTWGLFRPRVLLPSGADAWSAERREVVLAHELAHIRRADWALQLAAEVVRAVYWFNPLVWIACRRLRHESEYACDDAVLEGGVEATEYATHLLDVARHAVASRQIWASAPAIAHPSTLERRVSAMLNGTLNRRPLTAAARFAVVFGLGALSALVASAAISATEPPAIQKDVVLLPGASPQTVVITALPAAIVDARTETRRPRRDAAPAPAAATSAAPAQQPRGSIGGVMRDASGAVLPGVRLTLTDAASGGMYSRVSDGSGAFLFPDLPSGPYALVAQLPGFASLKTELTLAPGESLRRQLSMRIGSLQETISVVCAAGGAALPATARGVMAFERRATPNRLFVMPQAQDQAAPTPVRVGGQIRAPRQIRKVNPICPPLLAPGDGAVIILEATIGVDGYVSDIHPLRPQTSNGFVESAMEAVRQWQYTPTLLNNVEVPVIMTVTVQFTR
jgi:beta-lactamase regulating signal transducer with metallopeptidase domain